MEPRSLGAPPEHHWRDTAFDGMTAVVLMIAPLFMGGRHPVGRLVYVLAVAALALIWLLGRVQSKQFRYRRCGLEWIMLLTSGLILVQLLPLPPRLLDQLSPRLAHYLPLWNSSELLGEPGVGWRTLSLVPSNTRVGLTVWSAHGLFLLLLIQRLETRRDVRRLIGCVAISGVVLAAVGMLQYLFSNDKFLWVHQDPYRGTRDVLRGPFYNENHFAHFLSLTLVPLWVCLRSCRADRRAVRERFTLRSERSGELRMSLLTIAWPCILFTILLARSRGGVIAALVAVVLGAAGIVCRDGLRRSHAIYLGGVITVLLVALSIHGFKQVSREVEMLATTSLEQLDRRAGRRNVWRAAREVVGQFTLCGAGVGSFRETFPLFYAEPRKSEYSYAESGLLQVAVETGLLGVALLSAGLLSMARLQCRFWRRLSEAADGEWALAAAVGLCISLIHSLFDFVWYLPSCFAMTVALMAALIRCQQLSDTSAVAAIKSTVGTRAIGATAMLTASLLLLTGVGPLLFAARASGSWNAYLLASRQLHESADGTPVDPSDESLAELRAYLIDVVRDEPKHVRAHLRLATHALQLFELRQSTSDNPMSLAQIRDAALASQFESRAAQDRWVDAVVGPNRKLLNEAFDHARRALELSPLQGVGYVYLAELAFLQSPGSSVHSQLLQQALRVRPYDSQVLYAAGRQAIFDGDVDRAIVFWRRAYHQDHEMRQRILMQLAPQLPADLFIAQFQLDLLQLLHLRGFYRQHAMQPQAAVAGQTFLDRLIDSWSTKTDDHRMLDAHLWRHAYSVAAELKDPRTVAIARHAIGLNPHDYAMRRRLALELLGQHAWKAAIEQLSWCVNDQPSDHVVAKKLRWAREQLDAVDDQHRLGLQPVTPKTKH